MVDPTELEARLAAIERRLERVEGEEARSAAVPAAGRDADVFWALEGLRGRARQPGAVLYTGTVTLPSGEHFEWQEGFELADLLGRDWPGLADSVSALAHGVRLLLLREILLGARTVAELGRHEALGTAGQLYHHLRQLVAAGWVQTTTRGRYAVPADRVVPLLVVLAAVGGR